MIDSSIYGQLKGVDVLGSAQQGIALADMVKDRQAKAADERKKQVLKNAYNAGLVQNPDGSVSYDEKLTLKSLADEGLGQEYLASKKQFGDMALNEQKQKAEMDNQNLEYTSRAIGAAKANPKAWPQIRADFITKTGANPASIPEQYDPNFIKQTESTLLTAAQRQAQANADRDFNLRERELMDKKTERGENKNSDLITPYGLALTPDDAKQLKSADEEKKNFDAKLDEMIALRKKSKGGAFWNREDIRRGKTLSNDLLLSYKNMAKLGVLSQSDEKIINAIIPPDPLEFNSPLAAAQGQDPILEGMKKFKEDSNKDFANKLNNRLRGGNRSASKELDITPEEAAAEIELRKTKSASLRKGGSGG